MTRTFYTWATLLLTACLLAGCGNSAQMTPLDISQRFWAAVIQENEARVKRYVRKDERGAVENLESLIGIGDPEFGRIIIDGDEAAIETTVKLIDENGMELPLQTYLVLEGKKWKVDYQRTISALEAGSKLERVLAQVRAFGSRLQEGFNQSFDELERALPKIEKEVERMESEIRTQIPEIKHRLESFAMKIEEAMERLMEEDGDPWIDFDDDSDNTDDNSADPEQPESDEQSQQEDGAEQEPIST